MMDSYTKFNNQFTNLIKETNSIIGNRNNFKLNDYTKEDGVIEVDVLKVNNINCNNILYVEDIKFVDYADDGTEKINEITTKSIDKTTFNNHIANYANPHNASREWFIKTKDFDGNNLTNEDYASSEFVHLDNTKDINKPVSKAMSTKLNELRTTKTNIYNKKLSSIKSTDDENMLDGKAIYDYAYGDFKKLILNKAYPIGTVYTSNIDTNPSSYFGGTWVKLDAGNILVDGSISDVPKGSTSVTLTTKNLPNHKHSHTITTAGAHSHGRGNMTITGEFGNGRMGAGHSYDPDGVIHTSGYNTGAPNSNSGTAPLFKFSASDGWDSSLKSSSVSDHKHTINSVNSIGASTPASISIIQPYLAVFMWKRTA